MPAGLVHVSTPRNASPRRPALQPRPENVSLRKFLGFIRGSLDLQNSRWVHVGRIEVLRGTDRRRTLRCETITEKPNTPPERGHFCSFRPLDPKYTGRMVDCPAIIFECNCHRWLFVWEYAMWYLGAALIWRGNAEYPEITNPMLRPGGCKHLIAGARAILSRKL